MTDDQLLAIQKRLYEVNGFKVDVYHSEKHRGVIAVPHGKSLHPFNVIYRVKY